MGILGADGQAAQLGLRGEVSLAKGVLSTVNGGVLRTLQGDVWVRDVQLGLRLLPFKKDTLLWAIEPGFSVPVGSIGADAGPLPTTSGSVDPTLNSDLVVGAKVLGLLGAQLRVPVVAGRDDLLQGPYARVDLRGALRQGRVVPSLGLSGLRQAPHSNGTGALWELAAVAGASIELGKTTGLGVSLRVPLWTDATERYAVAPGLSLRQVIRPSKGKDDDDEH